MWREMTIRLQLTLTLFSAMLIVLFATTSLFIFLKIQDAEYVAQKISESAVEILAQDFVRALVLKSPDVAVDMANKVEAFTSITHAVFLDNDGIPILNYSRTGKQRVDFEQLVRNIETESQQALSFVLPIQYQGTEYGTAFFRFDSTTFNAEFINFLDKVLLVVPLLLLISILVAVYLQRFFTDPIRNLADAFDKLTAGGHQSIHTESAASREMSQLLDGFNEMVSRIQSTQQLLAEEKNRLHITLESIADGVIATDEQGRVIYMNPAAEQITGWDEKQAYMLPAQDVYRLIDDNDESPLSGQIDETLLNGTVHISLERTAILTHAGEKLSIQSSIAPIFSSDRAIKGVVIIFQNVTEARELSRQLHHQATHDPLTQLMNRTEFERTLVSGIDSMQKNSIHMLLYLDLDQFKIVNDTSGHTAGDALLRQIAAVLRHNIRESDVVARLGGDEFAIFLPNCNQNQALDIAEKIRIAISEFVFSWEQHQFRIGVSIGAVPITTPYTTYSELMRAADLSCYAAKDHGRNQVHVYREQDQELIKRHSEMQWVGLLHEALEKGEFSLYAQHILPLDSHNQVEHTEILIRYVDKQGSLNPPGAFLPAAERYNLAPSIDRWVIRQILTNARLVEFLQSHPNMRVNINLSGLTLGSPKLNEYVSELLREAKLRPKSICFEITETSAVANLAATSQFMRNMKLLGCEFALDDFGIGVSSFAYLKNLPVDYLKIDGSFIKDIHTNRVNAAMVTSINSIGHVMNIRTVAEFVESEIICQKLQQIGVDFVQGHYVHMPCPLEDIFEELVSARQRLHINQAQ